MASHTFQLPHRSSRIESRFSSRTRKRRRNEDSPEDSDGVFDDEDEPEQLQQRPNAGVARLTAGQAEQYRTVGLLPHEDIPAYPFPHGPLEQDKTKEQRRRQSRLHSEHSEQSGVGGGPEVQQPHRTATTLRQRHVNVVTAIMHRCLLDGDFERAGKAWSLLLRSNPPLDVRRHDQWGIGAEILMRRGDSGAPAGNEVHHEIEDDSSDEGSEASFVPTSSYDEEGLQAARSYYELLIRRFPSRPLQSNAQYLPNATEFQPVMLNVWLYQVAFTRNKVLSELRGKHRDTEGVATDVNRDETGEWPRSVRQARLEQLRVDELREAELISAKLDELFRSPAYDRDQQLRHLHRMVGLWIEDLQAGEPALQAEPEGTPP